MRCSAVIAACLIESLVVGCADEPNTKPLGNTEDAATPDLTKVGAFTPPPRPERQFVELGRLLFFDKRLSGDETMSCATCHDPEKGFGDSLPTAIGHKGKVLARNTPTIINLQGRRPFFWDGRAETSEEQATGPILNPDEMAANLNTLVARLERVPEYAARFHAAFPKEGISQKAIGTALAAFEKTIVSADSPFDRYMRGDLKAMSPKAVEGLMLFAGKALCVRCHDGPLLTDNDFHNIGIAGNDEGRAKIVKIDRNGMPGVVGGFKTPMLRDIEKTGPYFHDGSAKTLEEVIDHYVDSGDMIKEKNGVALVRIGTSSLPKITINAAEKAALVEFMKALTGTIEPIAIPEVPESPPERGRAMATLRKEFGMIFARVSQSVSRNDWNEVREGARALSQTALEMGATRLGKRTKRVPRDQIGSILIECRALMDAATTKSRLDADQAIARLKKLSPP